MMRKPRESETRKSNEVSRYVQKEILNRFTMKHCVFREIPIVFLSSLRSRANTATRLNRERRSDQSEGNYNVYSSHLVQENIHHVASLRHPLFETCTARKAFSRAMNTTYLKRLRQHMFQAFSQPLFTKGTDFIEEF